MTELLAPRLTSFVGRESDVRAVADLLAGHRLVTISGPGGLGKTSLAGQVLLGESRPIAAIDLATISDGDEVAALVARVLRVAEQSARSAQDQVIGHLGERAQVLYVDNCEHVRDAVRDLVVAVLRACPNVAVLATSTVRLDVPGECLYDLAPLAVPDDSGGVDELLGSPSVRLLVDRARQLVPEFTVTAASVDDVRHLCRRLDGIPLAIELAALRLRVLSVADLNRRLDDRFAVLTGGSAQGPERHRTLRALVDWSYERCSDEERTLWARLSVFPGSFRLEAVEAVGAYGDLARERVLDVLAGLVERSIVVVERVGEQVRYRQLATLRDYGAALLAQRGETEATMAYLLDFCMTRSREMVEDWCGPEQAESLAIWRLEHPTLLAAFAWALARPAMVDAAAELFSLLRYHWIAGGQLSDGRRWADRILGLAGLSPARRGHVLAVASWVCLIQGDRDVAARHLTEAQDLAARAADPVLHAYLDSYGALLQMFGGELEQAVAGYLRCIPVFLDAGEQAAAQTALFQLAMAQTYLGRHGEALDTCRREMAIGLPRGELWDRAYAEWVTGVCEWHLGRFDRAEQAAAEALRIQRSFEDGICIALVLLLIAWIRGKQARPDEAGRAAAAAEQVWALLGTRVEAFGPHLAAEAARWTPAVRPDDRRPASSKLAAVRLGLDLLAGDADPTAAPVAIAGLSPRENEVYRRLLEGQSNKAIAEDLVVSPGRWRATSSGSSPSWACPPAPRCRPGTATTRAPGRRARCRRTRSRAGVMA
ncbi:ATP-binding protein [Raineyella fluvialis]|uniref:LuxR family transcriptional regulator n=1 Tax=Raineyella fluvialis TaxID=2662261 RepID=A0A5Q2F6P9_9ACTN|nr:LuxR C-terminal-related transcriptional regulator [Raineyella fluvialis]QGF22660.1 LuxR family transcriptional regulator [Raineyella fluvialis]